ncbi:MAG: DUF4190 domain-containing protein [Phycisphaerales bacterium]|nr:DUF4190 domain-containing protein [Phycisphaerales bacterium]
MTQTQQFDGTDHITMYHEPERTSIAAILGMVCSCIGCCGGVTAIFGVFLSIFGIVGISRSKGRVGGMGFAIAGLLIGLLMLALWGGILGVTSFGFRWMETNAGAPTAQILRDIESGDFDKARAAMGHPAASVEDEVLVAFRTAYMDSLGPVVSETKGWGELFTGYGAVSQQMQQYNGRPNMIPLPMVFDSGYGLVMVEMDPQLQANANTDVVVPIRILVVDADGNEFALPPHSWSSSSSAEDAAEQVEEDLSGVEIEDFSDDSGEEVDESP